MGKPRGRQAQQTVQIELPRRGREQVCPAHDFGDAHPGIVHDDGQLVGEDAVCPAKVEVAAVSQQVLAVEAHAAIPEGDDLIGHSEPVGRCLDPALFRDLGRRQIPAGAGIDDIAVRGVGRTGRMELCAGAEAGVDQPLRFEHLIRAGVDLCAFALVIGAVGAAPAPALVPDEAQPGQVFFQQVCVFPGAALRVQILDAEDDAPARMSGAQPGQQAARKVAQMQPPAGAGGKPPDDRAHRPSFHSPSFG